MENVIKKDLTELDKIVVGRVEPHIYAFSTNTIPNHLKIGDTYRPVSIRLNEWKDVYPELKKEYEEKAMVNENVFFRDYSVHQFLESDLHKKRINPNEFPNINYVSNEFFKDTSVLDIQSAIDDIQKSYEEKLLKYKYYDATTSLETIEEYPSTGYWKLRPNQEEVVENFKNARKKGRTNLLMYAVMRFGKSFTAMCCALEMKAKIVLIVSAKADVKEEWKKTIQSADNFDDYTFLDSYSLNNDNAIKEELDKGKNVAIFLTLQDLQGKEIKERHKVLFDNNIDLLLIDETHFGARAESFGYVLRNIPSDVSDNREDGFIEFNEANDQVKVLKSKVRIHLSGTPYRILMGSEFSKDDIIAFCQFPDIVDAQAKWDEEYLNKENYNEWDNPYYGFPQMIRFAFNPNESVRRRIEELKQNGISFAFSELLRPLSIEKDTDNNHKKLKYEKEVLDLLEVIDGSKEDENVLGFLNYDKIKQGKMCRHIVMVLPFCASCDCIESLIMNNKDKFKNLCEYEIVNISGVDQTNIYKTVNDVKNKIKECEKNDKKTLTLTVNRMLTGSTVEQWDTMIYLKDTASPQEYDQSIFRLQNQYVTEYLNLDTGDTIKYNKKPQTVLVDFDPNRMFLMQETKSLIYNANIDKSGNSKLEERLRKELKISPIITLNKNKIHEVQAIDIMEAVSNYSKNRGVFEEVCELPVDLSLIDYPEILSVIEKQAKLGSKQGLKIYDDSSQEELEFGDDIIEEPNDDPNEKTKTDNNVEQDSVEKVKNDIASRFRTYYARILFFAMLSKSNVSSLENIIDVIDEGENQRIAQNLGLEKNILSIINKQMDIFTLRQLDYKIQNINKLSNDTTLSELDRANTAINKFDKLSESEIITPQKICNEMINTIGVDKIINAINQNKRILDLGSKKAEFTLAIVNILKENRIPLEKYKNNLYSIPTSSVAYEFTRRIYELLNLNINNIAEKFIATDIIKIRDRNNEIDYAKIKKYLSQNKEFNMIELEDNLFVEEGDDKMKFDVIVGNPPYTEVIKKEVSTGSSKQLFPYFIMTSIELSERYVSLITPSRWFVGGEQAGYFPKLRNYMKENNHIRKLVHFTDYSDVFGNDVTIPGGVNYFLSDNKYSGNVDFVTISNGKEHESNRKLFEDDLDIVLADYNLYSILSKVRDSNFESYMDIVGEWNSYGVVGQAKYLNPITVENPFEYSIRVQCAYEKNRYIKYEDIPKQKDSVKKWKVFTSKGNGGAGTLQDGKPVSIIGKSFVAEPNSICTDSLIPIGCFETEVEAINVRKYMATKFLRFMVGILKVSQNIYRNVYKFVPIQNFTNNSDIDWTKSIKEIDDQLYKKYGLSLEEIDYIESKIKEMD